MGTGDEIAGGTATAILEAARRCLLADAQYFIALVHEFASWPKFVAHLEALTQGESAIVRFEKAADAIVTGDLDAARRFTAEVDSAAVMVNASTRFNDGGEFGLGAEIGISTDKFHARGPCGLRELTSYKYVVHGAGQVR